MPDGKVSVPKLEEVCEENLEDECFEMEVEECETLPDLACTNINTTSCASVQDFIEEPKVIQTSTEVIKQ